MGGESVFLLIIGILIAMVGVLLQHEGHYYDGFIVFGVELNAFMGKGKCI